MVKSRTKPRRALLVNPWIYDFAAYNFWIRPLGLYHVAEWLWERGVEPVLVDCLSPFDAPGKFKRKEVERPEILKGVPRQFSRYGISPEEFLKRIHGAGPIDVAFVTSIMSYWYPGVEYAIRLLRESLGDIKVVLGGVYTTLWTTHAQKRSGADLVLRGPIQWNSQMLASFIDVPHSPIRENKKWYELGLHDGLPYSAIRTANGCPFRCSYCGSFMISGRYHPRTVKEVVRELEFLHGQGVTDIAFYDDALLVDFHRRLRPVLDRLKEMEIGFRFHTPNGLHARYIDEHVAHYFKEHGFETIRISLETTSPKRQAATGGKVTNRAVVEAVENLVSAGIEREKIGVYLLCGLPGQGVAEVEESIRFVTSLGVRPYLAEYSPIPGTIEWDSLIRDQVISPDIDPLLTNNTLFFRFYSSIGEEDWKRLQALRTLV